MEIVDVPALLERLELKATRRGNDWWLCCPLPGHVERTPSFRITDDPDNYERHSLWQCLGACHTGGNVADLVMRVLGLGSGREARAWIRDGGMAERQEPPARIELVEAPARRAPSLSVLPPGVVFAPLEDWPRAAREYAEGRGLEAWQVERWGLGVAVDGHFAGMIVFPWRVGRKIVGWTARAFLPGQRKHDEPGKNVGAPLGYVLGEAGWAKPGERKTIVICEGAYDGFAVERACSVDFGACRGSNLVPAHSAKIATFDEVVVAGDPDAAGEKFGEALRASLGRWTRLRFAEVPAGFDVAKYERREGPKALAALLGLPERGAPPASAP